MAGRRKKMPRQLTHEFQSLLNRARKNWFEKNRAIAREEPLHHLYHYTDSKGLTGILESGKLWATDARYLNDASELAYGCELVDRVLEEKRETTPTEWTGQGKPPVDQFLESALTARLFDPYEPGRFAFVTCFCEKDDLLSQWRAYADRGAGYSIGFHWGGLFNNPRSAMDQPLSKVVYDEQVQLTLIRELVDEICRALEAAAAPDTVSVDVKHALIDDALRALRIVLMEYLPYFKHSSFQEEHEWRIVQNCDAYEEYEILPTYAGYEGLNLGRVKFRSSAGTIAPYVELDLGSPGNRFLGKLAIASVRHGPAQHPALAKAALRILVEKQGYQVVVLGHEVDAVQILGSDVPLRV
jgi:hypothetical protein